MNICRHRSAVMIHMPHPSTTFDSYTHLEDSCKTCDADFRLELELVSVPGTARNSGEEKAVSSVIHVKLTSYHRLGDSRSIGRNL